MTASVEIWHLILAMIAMIIGGAWHIRAAEIRTVQWRERVDAAIRDIQGQLKRSKESHDELAANQIRKGEKEIAIGLTAIANRLAAVSKVIAQYGNGH